MKIKRSHNIEVKYPSIKDIRPALIGLALSAIPYAVSAQVDSNCTSSFVANGSKNEFLGQLTLGNLSQTQWVLPSKNVSINPYGKVPHADKNNTSPFGRLPCDGNYSVDANISDKVKNSELMITMTLGYGGQTSQFPLPGSLSPIDNNTSIKHKQEAFEGTLVAGQVGKNPYPSLSIEDINSTYMPKTFKETLDVPKQDPFVNTEDSAATEIIEPVYIF